MEHPEPNAPDVLPPDLHRRALAILRRALPAPLDGDPNDTTARDADAIGDVASLRPANPEETLLAVQFVVADAQANDILGVMNEDKRDGLRHIAESANMMRRSQGARSLLLRVQAARLRRERIADATVRRSDAVNARARVRPVAVSGPKPQFQENETPMRQINPMSATTVASDSLSSARFVSSHERMSRIPGNETLMRQNIRVPLIAGAGPSLSAATPVSETTARRASSELSTTDAPNRPSSPRFVSKHETLSRTTVIETSMRHVGPIFANAMAPDRWPGPRSASGPSTQDRALEWTERPLFTPPISFKSWVLATAAYVPETIVRATVIPMRIASAARCRDRLVA